MARKQIRGEEIQIPKRLIHSHNRVLRRVRIRLDGSTRAGEGGASSHCQNEHHGETLSPASVDHSVLSFPFTVCVVSFGHPPSQQDGQRHQYRSDAVGEGDDDDLPHAHLSMNSNLQTT